jgi:hypothetical protein
MVRIENSYFSPGLQWTLSVGSLVGIYLIFGTAYWWISLMLLAASLISLSTKYKMSIDLNKKIIIDSFHFLLITVKSESFNYNTLHCIRLDKL